MRIRVTYDASSSAHTRVEDADTGEVIPGVGSVTFTQIAGKCPVLTLVFVDGFEVEAVLHDSYVALQPPCRGR